MIADRTAAISPLLDPNQRACVLAAPRQKGHARGHELGRPIPGLPFLSANGAYVTHSLFCRQAAVIGAAVVFGVSLSLSCARAEPVPSGREILRDNAAGDYLAARQASIERDAATAAGYYLDVLKSDPRNPDLLNDAFLSEVQDGKIDEASKLAERLLQVDHSDRIARLVIGVREFKQKHYLAASQSFNQSVNGPVTDLAAALLSAWALEGAGEPHRAVTDLDRLAGPDWYGIFKDLHAGLILDLANRGDAGKRYLSAYKADPTALRTVQAYSSWLSRHGKTDEARKILADFSKVLPNHPLIVSALEKLGPGTSKAGSAAGQEQKAGNGLLALGSSGEDVKLLQTKLKIRADGIYGRQTWRAVREFQRRNGVSVDGIVGADTSAKLDSPNPGVKTAREKPVELPPLVDSASAGAAEALYGIGASIGRRGGEDLAIVYLRLALYLDPSHGMAELSLADLDESLKKPDLAVEAYERVRETSPLYTSAQIQSAADLDLLGKIDQAKARLSQIIARQPKNAEALMALGNIEREHKEFATCADTYGKAIDTVAEPGKSNWVMFYFRGICYQQSNQWPKAQADMQKALQLYPDQPLVLNYLGYSWVDKGVHLKEGTDMIRRAVDQRPDDGYIVDSLGWAYYRTGNYTDAVKYLERAVLLKPEDPTINDHLGDALWRVGRTLEAHFQWSQAIDFKPEEDELVKLRQKLKTGLPADTPSSAGVVKPNKAGNGG
jgi:tetratricopeptide (TPR) repeat protein